MSETMRLTWDRGTLVLRTTVAVRDVEGLVWDPRIEAWRAPGSCHGALIAELGRRGAGVEDHALRSGPAPRPIPIPELRNYQQAALDAWEVSGRRGIVVLPTGAGKTRTAIAAIAATCARTLVLVPTRVLLDQWAGALEAAGAGPVGRHGDGERSEGPVTVASFASARVHADSLGNGFDLVVVDEAHHFGGLAGGEFLEMCTAGRRLGLTATPPEDADRLARLQSLIGPVVYRSAVGELVGRFLSPFRIVSMALGLSATERHAYEAEVAVWRPVVRTFFENAPGADWADFAAAAQRSDTGRLALAAWRRSRELLRLTEAKRAALDRILARHAHARVLVFAPDARTAYVIAQSILAPAITADIGRKERAAILAAFTAGTNRIIVSARVLNEGVDVPEAEVAVIAGGTQGAREYVQRVGRVLRPATGKEAVVYELVTTGTFEGRQVDVGRRGLDARGAS